MRTGRCGMLRGGAAAMALMTATAALAHEDSNACLEGKLEHAEQWLAAFDEETGRDLRNYPPDRLVDHRHMKLRMRFEDLEQPRFTAHETLTVAPIGAPVSGLELDAIGLDVTSVTCGDHDVEFFVEDESITLRFEPPLPTAVEHDIEFTYACERPYAGLYFTPTAPDMPDYTAEVHTQGQTITNRHWFISHDSPNDQMTTELIVDVPAGYQVSSNGLWLYSI